MDIFCFTVEVKSSDTIRTQHKKGTVEERGNTSSKVEGKVGGDRQTRDAGDDEG